MAKVQFGWFVPALGIEETGYTPLAIYQQDAIIPAAAAHFDSLWVSDHLYAFGPGSGGPWEELGGRSDPWLEGWTTLTWLAARFPTLRVGNIVLAVGFRHPPLLAKMAATLQALSGGRLIMGIGGGWREEEYRTYGYAFPPPAVRIKQLAEAVEIMRRLWTEPVPTFEGEYYRIEHAYCSPRPAPPPPIMIGGGGEKLLLPLAARVADIWDWYHFERQDNIDMAAYQHKVEVLRRHAAAAGRDPAAIGQSVTIGQARLPAGSAESRAWLDYMAPLLDLGVRQFILDCGHVTSAEPIQRFAEEVMAPIHQGWD
jgi:alkanesulfonate monooxygenase SsuD/methylene tetrahydromethanopterin reductase-like flavin-dependent oxidoreductase (luciferase family)